MRAVMRSRLARSHFQRFTKNSVCQIEIALGHGNPAQVRGRSSGAAAGPIKTLAARGVSGISKMVDHHKDFAPLRHATEQGEVGDTALFLISPLGRGITGEVIYVDGGYHILGSLVSSE